MTVGANSTGRKQVAMPRPKPTRYGEYMMNFVKLQFSDARPHVEGIENVNAVLRSVGVCASTVTIPDEAKPILKASQTRPISEDEQNALIRSLFFP